MKRPLILLGVLVPIIFLFPKCNKSDNPISNESNANGIVLTNGFLIDGTGSQPIPNVIIVIADGHIKSVGTGSDGSVPRGATVIDLQGSYILPGLMNAHVHSGYDEDNLKEWAQSGVTTVRDLGNLRSSPEQGFAVRDALSNDNENSRLVAAGPLVTTVGGYGNYPVTSPDDAEIKINGLIDAGADLIKVAIEDDLQGRTWPMLSLDEIKRIVQTAHNRDRPVSAHISRSRHLNIAVQCGVDDVCHMIIDSLPDSLITAMIGKDIYWVPTLELWSGVSQMYNLNWIDTAKDNLRRFVQAGGKVALGTDYDGYITPFDLGMPIHEIQLMQEAGMTAMQILVAATKHAALVCNLEDQLGTIEPGKIADLVIVKGNPLDDLESLLDVQMVIHNGELIRDSREH
jgi:imidazolonepropionase-like amidohydrolase